MAAQQITCPHCQKSLKPVKLPAIGARVKCPMCKTDFTLEEKLLSMVATPPPLGSARGTVPVAELAMPVQQVPTNAISASDSKKQKMPAWAWAVIGMCAATMFLLLGWIAATMSMNNPNQPIAAEQEKAEIKTTLTDKEVANSKSPSSQNEKPQSILAATTPIVEAKATEDKKEPTQPEPKLTKVPEIASSTDFGKADFDKTETPETAKEPQDPAKEPVAAKNGAEPQPAQAIEKKDPQENTDAAEDQKPEDSKPVDPQPVEAKPVDAKLAGDKSDDKKATPKAASNDLVYALKKDLMYKYDFEVSLASESGKLEPTKGNMSYSLLDSEFRKLSLTEEAFKNKGRESASAFIVHQSGWIISSAQAVENAESIETIIDGKLYKAKLISTDKANDLALLKIDATNLSALPLASESANEGQDASVAGYIQDDVNGQKLKITHGKIAGFVNKSGERWIQFDTAIKSGNTGGPLLDAKGRVLGAICGSNLSDTEDSLGLAADFEHIQALLEKNKVNSLAIADKKSLSGAELAKKISKSVITLSLSSDGLAKGEQIQISCFGMLYTKGHNPDDVHNMMTITTKGEFISHDYGARDLSLISTSMGKMAFIDLPADNVKQWQSTRERKVIFTSDWERPVTYLPGTAIPHPNMNLRTPLVINPTFRKLILGRVTVEDTTDYEIIRQTAEKTVIKTKIKSKWSTDSKGTPVGTATGTGEYTFDNKQKILAYGVSEYKLRLEADGIETMIPIRLVFKLTGAFSKEQLKAASDASRKKSEESSKKRQSESADKFAKAMNDIKNPKLSATEAREALDALINADWSKVPTEAERKSVSPHLERWLKSEDENVRSKAIDVAEKYATAANIPTLLELLQTEKSYHLSDVIKALGTTGGNEKVAKMMAKLLETSSHRYNAKDALKRMPKFAESAVLPMLDSREESTRRAVLDVLEETGGVKSRDAIKAKIAKADTDRTDYNLKSALEKINERLALKLE